MELCSAVEPILVLASAKALHTTEIKQGDWSASWVEHEGWQLQLVCVPAEGGGHVVQRSGLWTSTRPLLTVVNHVSTELLLHVRPVSWPRRYRCIRSCKRTGDGQHVLT